MSEEERTQDTFAVDLTPEQARIIILALGVFLDRSIDFLNTIIDIDKKINEKVSPATLDFVRLTLGERHEMSAITRELVEKSGSLDEQE